MEKEVVVLPVETVDNLLSMLDIYKKALERAVEMYCGYKEDYDDYTFDAVVRNVKAKIIGEVMNDKSKARQWS